MGDQTGFINDAFFLCGYIKMNRELKHRSRKGCSFYKGGGFEIGSPLVPFQPADDQTFSVKMPVNQPFSDCIIPVRPGQLDILPQPDLAQTVMAGGKSRKRRGGYYSEPMPLNYPVTQPITQGFPNCGGVNVQSTLMSQARPELAQSGLVGGGCGCTQRKRGGRRTQRRQRGGTRGFSVDPWQNVGGDGPNAAPQHTPVPCDPRAGSMNPLSTSMYNPDPRAPADVYSLTPNQTGGSYGMSNGYSDDCYKAPGSSLPVYPAETAGFRFEPSTEHGGTLPDGITAYMDVVPQPARVGGRRTLRKNKKRSRRGTRK